MLQFRQKANSASEIAEITVGALFGGVAQSPFRSSFCRQCLQYVLRYPAQNSLWFSDVSFSSKRGAMCALILSFNAVCCVASSHETMRERSSVSNLMSDSSIMASPSISQRYFRHTCGYYRQLPNRIRRLTPGLWESCRRHLWHLRSGWCQNTTGNETEECRRRGL